MSPRIEILFVVKVVEDISVILNVTFHQILFRVRAVTNRTRTHAPPPLAPTDPQLQRIIKHDRTFQSLPSPVRAPEDPLRVPLGEEPLLCKTMEGPWIRRRCRIDRRRFR